MAEQVIAGRYRLEHQIGAGGMSEVWRATDLELERTVALKLLGPNADPARFEREARAVAALAHPNICGLYAYGEADRRPFMVLEYLPGGSLEDRLGGGRPLPDEETLRIATAVAAGLAHAHERGVVHRDLKPANVLFDVEGRPKIADFGIARLGASTGLTQAGTVLGTAAYISPEQAAGREATAASDVYAFGVSLFRMLTGRLPFESADGLALAAMHQDKPPPAVSELRPDAPPRLESLATAALAKSPADRPRDGSALLTELEGLTTAVPEATAVTQVLRHAPPRRSRSAVVLVVAAALAAAGVALAIAVTFRGGSTTTPLSTSQATTRTRPATTTEPARETTPETQVPVTEATTGAEPTTSAPTTEITTTAPTTTAPPTTAPPATTTAPPPPPTTTSEPAPTTGTTPTTAPATTATTTQPG